MTVLRLILITSAALAVMPAAASAATFTVSGTSDPAGASCVATTCDSLRAAVAAASEPQNVGSTVQLAAGTYTLSGGASQASGVLSIPLDMTIVGAGIEATTIQQTDPGLGVVVIPNALSTVAITDLAITGGAAVGAPQVNTGAPGEAVAGGISNAGELTLTRVAVRGNTATGGPGGPGGFVDGGVGGTATGGIGSTGQLRLVGSRVTGNTATGGAGGSGQFVAGRGGTAVGGISINAVQVLSVTGSTVSSNAATGGVGRASGQEVGKPGGIATGGIAATAAATVGVTGSAFTSNRATGGAGAFALAAGGSGGPALGAGIGMLAGGTLTVQRSTFALGSVTGGAGGSTTAPPNDLDVPGVGGDGEGGGIYLTSSANLVNATIMKNSANAGGGGTNPSLQKPVASGRGIGGGVSARHASGVLELANVTLAANAVTSPDGTVSGGNLATNFATTARATIFGAPAAGANCSIVGNVLTDAGRNLAAVGGADCKLVAPTDLVDVDPELGPLKDNGGGLLTSLPGATSPARRSGGACVDPSLGATPSLLTIDGRGRPRTGACDIGAVQTQPPSVAVPTITGDPRVGQSLACSSPTSGDEPLTVATRWARNGVEIGGASGTSYELTAVDAEQTLTCTVTASGPYGAPATATSSGFRVGAAPVVATPTPTPAPPSAPSLSTPAPATQSEPARFLGATLVSTSLRPRGKGLGITVACPATAPGGSCAVKITVYSGSGSLPGSASPATAKGQAAKLASGTVTVNAGEQRTLQLRLTAAGRTAVRRASRVRVVLDATAGGSTAATTSATKIIRAR